MIALVAVCHSAELARAACALVEEMLPDGPRPVLLWSAGAAGGGTGTDATDVAATIRRAAEGADGVLVLVDLGSAVLAAETALELLDPEETSRVRISSAPLVEGLTGAYVTAAGGGDLQRCCAEAECALAQKSTHLDAGSREDPERGAEVDRTDSRSVELPVLGEHGLHARPAARVVALVDRYAPDTRVRLRHTGTGTVAPDARSLSAVVTLGARQGDVLRAEASGPGAEQVLAELVDLAGTSFGDDPGPAQPLREAPVPVPPAVSREPGVAGSGLDAALGPVVVEERPDTELPPSQGCDPAAERAELRSGIAEVSARLTELRDHAARHLGSGEAEVFAAHLLLLADPELTDRVLARIDAGQSAARAWRDQIEEVASRVADLPDEYQRERAQDVRSVGRRVLRQLLGQEPPERAGHGILVTDELDPAVALALDAERITGVLTRCGGPLGHGVLVARARGIPVLTGVGAAVDVPDGTLVAFDARSGRLEVDPPVEVRTAFEDLLARRGRERARALGRSREPAVTRDGVRIIVKANVSSLAVARLGASLGAEGSGLVRTEAVFAGWETAPTVAEQVEVFTSIAEAYAPHPVTIRTWDAGGDKPLRFLPSPVEANPFLGRRGLRAFRDDPGPLLDQLEAMCRVARDHRVNALVPMVTSVADVEWVRGLLAEAAGRIGLDRPPRRLGLGIMVEVPAVAVRLSRLARGLDLVSIGSNDLTQFTLAAERGNPHVQRWADPLDPAVLQLIRWICDRAPEGVVVSLCGEMAGDPSVAPLLVGLGVRELSASATTVPIVKARLRESSLRDLQDLAAAAVVAHDADAVRDLLART